MEKGIEEKYGATLCALRSYKSIGFFSREYALSLIHISEPTRRS